MTAAMEKERKEVLPCPFCGWADLRAETLQVRLDPKTLETQPVGSLQHWCGGINPSLFVRVTGKDRKSAIAKWNARASISPQVPVEAIKDAINCMEQVFSLFARSIEEHPSPNTKELTDELARWGRSIEALRTLLPEEKA